MLAASQNGSKPVQLLKRTSVTAVLALGFGLVTATVPPVLGAASAPLDLRIYDPAHITKSQVTAADVVRASAKVASDPATHVPSLMFQLTKRGAARFLTLTRALARRGARLHRDLPLAFEVDGRVWARPVVDYKAFPDGLHAEAGLEFSGLTIATERKIVALIHQG